MLAEKDSKTQPSYTAKDSISSTDNTQSISKCTSTAKKGPNSYEQFKAQMLQPLASPILSNTNALEATQISQSATACTTAKQPVQSTLQPPQQQEDAQLDMLLTSVQRQKQIALGICKEVNQQAVLIEKIDDKCAATEAKMKKQDAYLNKLLKKFF